MTGIRRGEWWGRTPSGPHPDVRVTGDDTALATAAVDHPGALIKFIPTRSSDLARALGLGSGSEPGTTEVAVDVIRTEERTAVNAVVVGAPPDRLHWWTRSTLITVTVDGRQRFRDVATTVLVANGQYLRGADVVPRGHPGDGRVEIQVYAVERAQRRALRERLPRGAHLPHPRIHQFTGRRVGVEVAGRSLPVEVDGGRRPAVRHLALEVVPAALRLLV